MKYLQKILEFKLIIGLIYLTMGFIVAFFTNIKFVDYTMAFIVATFIAFYIEYNNNQSKLMVMIRKYF